MSSQESQNYSFGDKIGSGSFSTVFKAYPKETDRKIVAIKVINKSLSAVDSLISEIKLLKSLKHKHIVEMIDFFWDEKNIMIVMEYCDGGDLSTFIKRKNRLPEIVCKRFLQQLADALKYLRSRNISHMDLKPSNLLLSSGQILKLADFGFAQYLSCEETKNNSLRGSPLYMAPEMLLERKYDAKVDLWSVGVIMYECLFGRAPYSSRTFEELAEKIKQKAPIEIPSSSSISAGCADLLKKLLVHDPEQRIDFESFFKSEYLDLEHMPCEASMDKAINLVRSAIKHDVENKQREAFQLYCDALQYFVPLINAETDENKRVLLRNKVDEYVKRAEELKVQLYGGGPNDAQQSSGSRDVYHRLMNLCASTPKLVEALRIGHVAEQYLAEGKHVAALTDFQLSIGILLGYLGNEPSGVRNDLLRHQTKRWLHLAEDAKRTSTLQTYPETKKEASTIGKEMCLLQ